MITVQEYAIGSMAFEFYGCEVEANGEMNEIMTRMVGKCPAIQLWSLNTTKLDFQEKTTWKRKEKLESGCFTIRRIQVYL